MRVLHCSPHFVVCCPHFVVLTALLPPPPVGAPVVRWSVGPVWGAAARCRGCRGSGSGITVVVGYSNFGMPLKSRAWWRHVVCMVVVVVVVAVVAVKQILCYYYFFFFFNVFLTSSTPRVGLSDKVLKIFISKSLIRKIFLSMR
jgi:hypothetical protein